MSAFDNDLYLKQQEAAIMARVSESGRRLYLEFGGKLIDDYHAARVLPGFDPNVKLQLLQQLSSKADIILCIYAGDIERKKIRGDLGITYDNDSLRLIDELRLRHVDVTAVVITRFSGEPSAEAFKQRLEKHGISVFVHNGIRDYPNNIDHVVSERGFGANPFIPVTQPLVVVTGPGPSSGKMGTCLSQIYHEYQRNDQAYYAKFETFPVWNLPLSHPVNIAYEAATADLRDANAMDSFHYEAYGLPAVNYNRDLQAFPLLKAVLSRITGKECKYQSPTDMGVNCIAAGIVDDKAVREAATQEIARRYFHCLADYNLGRGSEETMMRVEEIVSKAKIAPSKRDVVQAARQAAKDCEAKGKGNQGIYCGAALKLHDGKIVTGKNSTLMHAASSMILNAVKILAGIPDSQHLLLPDIMESVANFKVGLGSARHAGLDVSETLITLVVSANANSDNHAKRALGCINALQHCDMHLTHIPSPGDEAGLRRLGCSYTYDPVVPSKNLFV